MMTTMAAMLGGLPLAVGSGTGSELHRPLGITIVGGLIVSQMLTLFTTPVVYVTWIAFGFSCAAERMKLCQTHRLRARRHLIPHIKWSLAAHHRIKQRCTT